MISKVLRSLSIGLLGLSLWGSLPKVSSAQMEILPDNTLAGEASTLDLQGNTTFIEGGATRDINLFHSFEEFNVDGGQAAYFVVDGINIENIFSRITGSAPSDILGTLGTCISGNCPDAQPSAALYLINPNGIFFGPNASLDVGGSFIATTANGIEFGENGVYGTAAAEAVPDLLTVNPSAFLFNQSIAQPLNSIESRATLNIPDSHSLLLVSGRLNPTESSTGDIVIREGRLRAPGGQIAIGGLVDSGRIELNREGNQLTLAVPDSVPRPNFIMTGEENEFAELDVTSGDGGNISVHAHNIDILGGSDVCAGIGSANACGNESTSTGSDDSQGGDILFNALGTVTIKDPISLVINDVYPEAAGNSGDIIIEAESFNLFNGGELSADTSGRGNSGKIIIDVADSVLLERGDSDLFIFNNVNANAIGDSGGVEITARSLEVRRGAQIQSLVRGQGTSGGVTVRTEEAVLLDGIQDDGTNRSPSVIASGLFDQDAEGQGGEIDIVAGSLSIENGARILSNTLGTGGAGDVSVLVEKGVLLRNSIILAEVTEGTGNGRGGNIRIQAGSLQLLEGSSLLADTENMGDAGNIMINVRGAVLLQGEGPPALDPNDDNIPSQISTTVESGATGRGGEITISANSLSVADDGFISSSTSGNGPSGSINVVADSISLQSGSDIMTSTFGVGDSGDISIRASDIVINGLNTDSQSRSSIEANVEAGAVGDGGDLNIGTDRLTISGGGTVSARTDSGGRAGSLTVSASETINLSGTTPDGSGRSNINAITVGAGRGGDLLLTTPYLTITEGAGVGVSTSGGGDAGSLRIQGAELIEISGSANAETPSWLDARTEEGSTGQGGSIEVQSNALRITDDALITAGSSGKGTAGEVILNIADTLHLLDGSITTEASDSSGGNITIRSGESDSISGVVTLVGDSDITTESSGDGGNITIRMPVVAFNDSDILARSGSANGGDITIGALFSDIIPFDKTEPFDGDGRVDINAEGDISEGDVDIADTGFLQNELAELSDSLSDIDSLVLSSCVVSGQESEGVIAVSGSENLQIQPGISAAETYSTGNVGTVEKNSSNIHLQQPDGAFVEPLTVYSLSDGRLVMSRPCI